MTNRDGVVATMTCEEVAKWIQAGETCNTAYWWARGHATNRTRGFLAMTDGDLAEWLTQECHESHSRVFGAECDASRLCDDGLCEGCPFASYEDCLRWVQDGHE